MNYYVHCNSQQSIRICSTVHVFSLLLCFCFLYSAQLCLCKSVSMKINSKIEFRVQLIPFKSRAFTLASFLPLLKSYKSASKFLELDLSVFEIDFKIFTFDSNFVTFVLALKNSQETFFSNNFNLINLP